MKTHTGICCPDNQVVELLGLKDKLSRRGFWKTVHQLDAVIDTLGWEIARDMITKEKIRRKKKKVKS